MVALLSRTLWVERFLAELERLGAEPGEPHARAVARDLWRVFGHLPPEPIARGQWDMEACPRNLA